MDLKSPLKKARGLGSAHSGTHHWWMQRVTAIALIPLVFWFVYIVICANTGTETIIGKLENPFNAVLMVTFLIVGLYHGALGVRVVLEDYVHCKCGRTILTLLINFFTVITAVAVILSVISVHTGGVKHKKWDKDDVKISPEHQEMWKDEFFKIFNDK